MEITYQQVFGVSSIGQELKEGQAVNYTPCPAVRALRQLLARHTFFAGSRLGGTGPLYRPWKGNSHEFNRHHAGLSVDIMLDPKNASHVALGQQLTLLFHRHASTLRWRGLIYQNVTLTTRGAVAGGGHEDHIHIDWHDSKNVRWKTGLASVPLRLSSGQILSMPLVQGNQIAESITWTAEAATDFSGNASFANELADLMARQARGELTKVPWGPQAFTGSTTAMNTVPTNLVGNWRVSIGNWNGIFRFEQSGTVYWTDGRSGKHYGRWTVKANRAEWKFNDVGDFRTFTAPLPLNTAKTSGTILPAGQGWFVMAKTQDAIA